MKKLSIVLGASVIVLAGCGGAATSAPDVQATTLESGQHGAITENTLEQYHNQADLKAGWDKLYAGQTAPALPNVDFTKDTVVLYAIGEHKTGGFRVRVIKSEATPGGYTVQFEVSIPGTGCHNTTQEITRAFMVISVPTASQITFEDSEQRHVPACAS